MPDRLSPVNGWWWFGQTGDVVNVVRLGICSTSSATLTIKSGVPVRVPTEGGMAR